MSLRIISRPGSKILWLSGTVRGQRIRESTGTNNHQLAEEKRAAREAEVYRSDVLGVKVSRSFAEGAISYLKRGRSEDTKRRLHRFLGYLKKIGKENVACDRVNQDMLDHACDALLRPGAADTTRLREVVSPVRAVLRHAAVRGWCTLPVFETIRQGKRRKEWLTPGEAEAIIGASPTHLVPVFEFMFCTGARRGEVLGLDWQICPGEVRAQHAARRQIARW
jgi:integrase